MIISSVDSFSLDNFASDSINQSSNTTFSKRPMLNVSSEGPLKLKQITEDIKTKAFYEGYDNNTLRWMESLGDKDVFVSTDEYVIMDKWDLKKIPTVFATDVRIDEFFECDIVENHSLGDGENLRDVLLVKNVSYIGNNTFYYEV